MRTAGMEDVRNALKAFSANGNTTTVAQMRDALGAETESQRQMVRRRIQELIERGEVERVGQGHFRYIPGREPRRHGESYIRTWRIIRIQPPGWTKSSVASIARVGGTVAQRYVNFLEEEGLVERCGRERGTILWRTTEKGQVQRETPWPPTDIPDVYAKERAAMASLCTLMLTADLDKTYVREKLKGHLAILNEKFFTQVENGQNTEGESHV